MDATDVRSQVQVLVQAAEFNLASAVSSVNRSLSLSIAPFMLSAVQASPKHSDEWGCFGKGNLKLKTIAH